MCRYRAKIFIDVQNGLPYYFLIMMYTRRRFFVGIVLALVKPLTEKMFFLNEYSSRKMEGYGGGKSLDCG